VREVREADDRLVAHACRLAQHLLGVAQVLQGVELQHDVEAVVVEDRQAVFQVELQHLHAAADALRHQRVVDLDAEAAAAALVAQVRHQRAAAAAEVEHAAALRHQRSDVVDAVAGVHHANSRATLPK